MDLKSIREQILVNLEHFAADEKKVIILKLLDYLKDLDEENQALKQEKAAIEMDLIAANSQELVNQIMDDARLQAQQIIQEAEQTVTEQKREIERQGKEYLFEFVSRLEAMVKEIKRLDEEAKLFRLHFLSIFKKTIYKFADSDYHIIKMNDEELRELVQFYQTDESLQNISDQIMDKLNQLEERIQLFEKNADVQAQIDQLEAILISSSDHEKEIFAQIDDLPTISNQGEGVKEKQAVKYIDVFNQYYR